ncbi:unnamed protein product [Paramecium octaurelia]|uniref:Protein kinase domain-containing protein n=1 Tax=Paramecium octaurelia TaxID=43137 RepID=A0A8S1UGX9_PAROT|nr:unnamed protein product [Paramecium octaurelia]
MPPKRQHHKTYSSEMSPSKLLAYPTHRDQPKISKSPTFQFDFKTSKQLEWFLFQSSINIIIVIYSNYYLRKHIRKFQQQDLLISKGFISPQNLSSNPIFFQSNLKSKYQHQLSNHIKTQPYSNQNTLYQNLGIGIEIEENKDPLLISQFYQKFQENFQTKSLKKNSLSLKQHTDIPILDIQQKQHLENLYNNQFHKSQGSFRPQNTQKLSQHKNDTHSINNRIAITPILQFNTPKEAQMEFQSIESLTARKKPILLLVLQYKMLKIKLQVEVSTQTIQHLVDIVRQEINKYLENFKQKIIGIQTCNLSIPVDYILSMTEKSLLILDQCQIKPLIIEPVFEIENEIQTSRVSLRDFEFIRCIGTGGFSKVYLVRQRQTGKYFAMKLIEKGPIIQQNKQKIIQNERDIMCLIDDPFVVKMYYAFESRRFFVFVLEYCSGGELFFLLRKIKRMSEKDAFFYFSEICLGMKTLHSSNIIYRDIKPENILIDLDGHIRIADFGLSKPNMIETENAYSFCGSSEYMAPEMLLKSGHTFQLDLYCLGALLYELITGLPPFYSRNLEEIYQRILNQKLNFPPQLQLSSSIKNLLTNLLAKNPKDRIDSIDTVLKHPWMTQWGDQNLYKDINSKKINPPYVPDYFALNFDEKEFGKGEGEFLQFIKPLQKSMQENFPKDIILKEFYFNKNENICDEEDQKNQELEQKCTQKLNKKGKPAVEDSLPYHKAVEANKYSNLQRILTEVEPKLISMNTQLN